MNITTYRELSWIQLIKIRHHHTQALQSPEIHIWQKTAHRLHASALTSTPWKQLFWDIVSLNILKKWVVRFIVPSMLKEVDRKVQQIAQQALRSTTTSSNQELITQPTTTSSNQEPITQPTTLPQESSELSQIISFLISLPTELIRKHVEKIPFGEMKNFSRALMLHHRRNCNDLGNHQGCQRSNVMHELKRVYKFCSQPQFDLSVRKLFMDDNSSNYQKRLCSDPVENLTYEDLKAIQHDMEFMVSTGGAGGVDSLTGKTFSPLTDAQLIDVFDYAFKTKNLSWMEKLCKGSRRILDLFEENAPVDISLTEKIAESFFCKSSLQFFSNQNRPLKPQDNSLSFLENYLINKPSLSPQDQKFYKEMIQLFILDDCFKTSSFMWNTSLLTHMLLFEDLELMRKLLERINRNHPEYCGTISICAYLAIRLQNLPSFTYLLKNNLDQITEHIFVDLCKSALVTFNNDEIKTILISRPDFYNLVCDDLDTLVPMSLRVYDEKKEAEFFLDKLLDTPNIRHIHVELILKSLKRPNSSSCFHLFFSKMLDPEKPQRHLNLDFTTQSTLFQSILEQGFQDLLDKSLNSMWNENPENSFRSKLTLCEYYLCSKDFTKLPNYKACAEVLIQYIMQTDQFKNPSNIHRFDNTITAAACYGCTQAMKALLQDPRCAQIGNNSFENLLRSTTSKEIKEALRNHPNCPKKREASS